MGKLKFCETCVLLKKCLADKLSPSNLRTALRAAKKTKGYCPYHRDF